MNSSPLAVPNAQSGARWRPVLLAGLGLWLALVILRCAWISDDAYITLRSVDNLVHGLGPIWNAGERVQSFTHPLWMGLLAIPYALTEEAFYTTLVTSLVVSAGFLTLFFRLHAKRFEAKLLALAVFLGSKSFIDYCTSGLENPLAHLLVALGFYVYFEDSAPRRRLLRFTLITALAACNRPDSVLLFAPAALHLSLGLGREQGLAKTMGTLLLGALPLVLWELFSIFYYGLPVPNTAYAKLNTGIPSAALWQQGSTYLRASFLSDPIGLGTLGLGLLVGLASRAQRALGLGLLLHLAYVLSIGGDFMVGRQFTASIVLALVLLTRGPQLRGWTLGAGLLACAIVGVTHPSSPLRAGRDYGVQLVERSYGKGVVDERAIYFPTNGMLRLSDQEHEWASGGRRARRQAERMSERPVVVRGTVGMLGYFAGPRVHLIDELALCDPLLARLPTRNPKRWRIGHFTRDLPAGYELTQASGVNRIEDPDLAAYWDQLHLIISGELWSWRRLRAIGEQLVGRHQARLDAYLHRQRSP